MFAVAKTGKLTTPGAKTRRNTDRNSKSTIKFKQTQLDFTKMENNRKEPAGTVKNLVKCKVFQNRLLLGTRSLLGKVDFCLRMNKQFPLVDTIWDIYGKIINMKIEKTEHEIILLMRNENSGAVLQAICNQSHNLMIGNYVRAVGRFIGINRFKVYTVDSIKEEVWHADFEEVHKLIETSLLELPL